MSFRLLFSWTSFFGLWFNCWFANRRGNDVRLIIVYLTRWNRTYRVRSRSRAIYNIFFQLI
jgi:hypothetical protein